ncbi:hypothetical protein D5086_006465 [Populus alba]|uniref:Uncharacterized protein n=1 Tax=Populus alba TaxID=43335 RepID=A0ACC4CKS3_POPAL
MVTDKQKKPQDEQEEEEVYSTESEGSDPDYDSDTDPSYSIIEDTRSKVSRLSIKKKSKSRVAKDLDLSFEKDPGEKETKLEEVDEKSYEEVQKIIQAGKLEGLKVEQCKVYLRKNKLRLTGKKDTLIQRIKEHQEILSGGGEKKYPISSFVLDCKGDACRGDIVMFDQNVYDKYNIASRSAMGPAIGTRMVAGKIVRESYGAAKQQHTFTIEVLWSKGENPLPPLHPLLIKGRNLYRMKTLRQRWEDEGERRKILLEKHSRGSLARSSRETRIQEKEGRKMLRVERYSDLLSCWNIVENDRQSSESKLTCYLVDLFSYVNKLKSSVLQGLEKGRDKQESLSVKSPHKFKQWLVKDGSETTLEMCRQLSSNGITTQTQLRTTYTPCKPRGK